MSDTPNTDAVIERHKEVCNSETFRKSRDMDAVLAAIMKLPEDLIEHAREQERELTEERRERHRMMTERDEALDAAKAANRALSETVAERDALENALVHMNDPGRWDPRNCEECAAVQRLLDGIYAKRVQEATK